MVLFRVIDREGHQVFSRQAGFSGTYETYDAARRAIIVFNTNPPYAVYGPFKIQKSTAFVWDDVDG